MTVAKLSERISRLTVIVNLSLTGSKKAPTSLVVVVGLPPTILGLSLNYWHLKQARVSTSPNRNRDASRFIDTNQGVLRHIEKLLTRPNK